MSGERAKYTQKNLSDVGACRLFFFIIIPSTAVGEALKMFNIQYRQPYAGRHSEGFLEIIL